MEPGAIVGFAVDDGEVEVLSAAATRLIADRIVRQKKKTRWVERLIDQVRRTRFDADETEDGGMFVLQMQMKCRTRLLERRAERIGSWSNAVYQCVKDQNNPIG